jgi:hypothetical protein
MSVPGSLLPTQIERGTVSINLLLSFSLHYQYILYPLVYSMLDQNHIDFRRCQMTRNQKLKPK